MLTGDAFVNLMVRLYRFMAHTATAEPRTATSAPGFVAAGRLSVAARSHVVRPLPAAALAPGFVAARSLSVAARSLVVRPLSAPGFVAA